ncbi:MAG: DUF1488 domain-containing protein [Ancalomicrobiaceae bacterium]|nr:DUF1488 domain-containing protein [Ancalomicrobiaceae bacterium]
MALDFLNDSRSYDPSHQYVTFWGHDSAFEITFRLDHAALSRFAGNDTLSEAAALNAFDTNIAYIRSIARKLYQGNPKRYWELSAKDI